MMTQPEVWLRGPLENISPTLMSVAHALLQASEDLEIANGLSQEQLWHRPNEAASIGFHLRHISGSIGRLLSYADGQQLSPEQMIFLKQESMAGATSSELIMQARAAIRNALQVLQNTKDADLFEPRFVGRQLLPSTVIGLLYHIGEHTSRHAGQVITTAKSLSVNQSGSLL
jgi:uncharacterized damage-inducible protein DinB